MNEENSKNTGNEFDAGDSLESPDLSFETFWGNFDPNHHWNNEAKTFIRQLWEMIYL